MAKTEVIFEFDDEKDAKQVLDAISKYIELSWNHDTKKAMIKVDKKAMVVFVSKSVDEVPKPLRLK